MGWEERASQNSLWKPEAQKGGDLLGRLGAGSVQGRGPTGDGKGGDEEGDVHMQRSREKDQVEMTQQCAVSGRALECLGTERS